MGEKALQSQSKESTPTRSQTNLSQVPYSNFSRNPLFPFQELQNTFGNQTAKKFLQRGILQTKLTIGEPDDLYEQEADRVADAVMRMSDTSASGQRSAVDDVQRKPG